MVASRLCLLLVLIVQKLFNELVFLRLFRFVVYCVDFEHLVCSLISTISYFVSLLVEICFIVGFRRVFLLCFVYVLFSYWAGVVVESLSGILLYHAALFGRKYANYPNTNNTNSSANSPTNANSNREGVTMKTFFIHICTRLLSSLSVLTFCVTTAITLVYTVDLFFSYRCSVLIWNVVFPFLWNELFYTVMVFLFYAFCYWMQRNYGTNTNAHAQLLQQISPSEADLDFDSYAGFGDAERHARTPTKAQTAINVGSGIAFDSQQPQQQQTQTQQPQAVAVDERSLQLPLMEGEEPRP